MAYQDPRSDSELKAAASSDQSARAELRDRGYQVGSEGGQIYVEGGSKSGGGGGGAAPPPQQVAVDPNEARARAFYADTAGFSIKDLQEKARQFDATLEFDKQKWREQGLPEVQIEQRAQALREWQAEQDIALQEQQLGISRGQLGLSYLQAASQMGGPASVFQQADFLRGARQRGDVPGFLGSLAANTQLPAFTGAGNATMIPQTAAGLSLQLGGGQSVTLPGSAAGGAPAPGTPGFGTFAQPVPTAGAATAPQATGVPQAPGLGTDAAGYSYDAALNQIGNIFRAGPTRLAPGSLERLDPNELAILKSGAQKLGYDPDAWLRAYSRAGVGQQSSSAF